MGGSKYKTLTVWPIFIFVALWHDFDYKMVYFGLGCSVVMMYE